MKKNRTILIFCFAVFFSATDTIAQKFQLSKVSKNDDARMISTAYLDYWLSNNGRGATDPNQGTDLGFYFPSGTPKSAIYTDGFVYAGLVELPDGSTELRSNGATYTTGLQAGKILVSGKLENGIYTAPVYANPTDIKYKMYKIATEKVKGKYDISERIKLETDYNNWPIDDGAPTDPSEPNKPYLMGDEVMYYVCNDGNPSRANQLYGSKPIGIEQQTTIWAYRDEDRRGLSILIKKRIINKSGLNIKDFYFGFWSDPDLGGAGDDLAGVDTNLQLCYMYNATNKDWTYNTGSVPAVGYALIQGPITNGTPSDTAYYYDQIYPGKRNIKSSSFVYYIGGGPSEYSDPPLGSPNGTIYLYRYMRGLNALGQPLTDNNGNPTKYMVAGDPVTKTGDLDGVKYAPGDRRLLMSFGPFNLMAGDTQDVIYSVVLGSGDDNISSISELRQNAIASVRSIQSGFPSTIAKIKPSFNLSAGNRKIVATLGNYNQNSEIEKFNNTHFKFEGYVLRQMDRDDPENITKSKIIGVYDIVDGIGKIYSSEYRGDEVVPSRKLLFNGNDKGIIRSIIIEKDEFTKESLINHLEYAYGLSWYAIDNRFSSPFVIESDITILKTRPVPFVPGEKQAELLTVLSAQKTNSSTSMAYPKPVVTDPTNLTGDSYEIAVSNTDINNIPNEWFVRNLRTQEIVIQSSLFEEGGKNFSADGILWQLINKDSDGGSLNLTPDDRWIVNTAGYSSSFSAQKAKSDLDRINIYPNPYFGGNQYETHRFLKKVTFTNLPNNVTIRIFTIAGSNVGTLRKNDERTTMDWNLLNESNFLVASGMYIAYIETPFGTKILKFAVIQDIPYLDAI